MNDMPKFDRRKFIVGATAGGRGARAGQHPGGRDSKVRGEPRREITTRNAQATAAGSLSSGH